MLKGRTALKLLLDGRIVEVSGRLYRIKVVDDKNVLQYKYDSPIWEDSSMTFNDMLAYDTWKET